MARRDPMVHIRMSEEMKSFLAANAKANCRSVNSEIVFGLKIYAQTLGQTKETNETKLGGTSSSVSAQ